MMDPVPVTPPARLPEPRHRVELTAKQRRARRAEEPRSRLNQKLIDDLEAAVRTGAPLNICYDYVGIHRDTVRKWLRVAAEAEPKRWDERSQLERRCVLLKDALRRAQGEAGMRIQAAIASAAGLTAQRPTQVVVRRTFTGNAQRLEDGSWRGEVAETEVLETTKAIDWRAAAHAGKYRFPEEMSDTMPVEEDESGGVLVSGRVLYERFQAIKRKREEAADRDGVIDTTATSVPTQQGPGAA